MKTGEAMVQGRTVRDALRTASKLFQVDEEQLRVEVLDEGRRGLFGLFGRPVTIRVGLRPESKSRWRHQNQDLASDREGMAEVSDGMLHVYAPSGRGQPPVIIPTHGAVLRVNRVEVHGPRPVRAEEEAEVELVEEVHPAAVEVEVSADGLAARAKVSPQITIRYELMDQNAQNVLQLLTRQREERVQVITAAEVETSLAAKGVTFGIDHEEIPRAVAAVDGIARVVARGHPVREGRNGFVEYLFDRDLVEILYAEEERVNYWERCILPSVKEGEVLAVLHPPVPGCPGTKVTGEAILPAPVREASLRAKDGVLVGSGGRKAVATIAGRPILEGFREPYLKVVPLIVYPGDVDMRSGNLRFGGDLLILGNVNERMQVTARGDITIQGYAAGALIQAGGKVACRGRLIGCTVRSGGLRTFYTRVAPLLDELRKILDTIIRDVTQIEQYPVYRGRLEKDALDRIGRFAVGKKKLEISALANEYAAALEGADIPLPPAVRELAVDLKNWVLDTAQREASVSGELGAILSKEKQIGLSCRGRPFPVYPGKPGIARSGLRP